MDMTMLLLVLQKGDRRTIFDAVSSLSLSSTSPPIQPIAAPLATIRAFLRSVQLALSPKHLFLFQFKATECPHQPMNYLQSTFWQPTEQYHTFRHLEHAFDPFGEPQIAHKATADGSRLLETVSEITFHPSSSYTGARPVAGFSTTF